MYKVLINGNFNCEATNLQSARFIAHYLSKDNPKSRVTIEYNDDEICVYINGICVFIKNHII